MFGLYRYILALAVVISHLCGIGILGWLAVHGFFILSGYLMTLILQRNYGYDKAGVARFMINRTLRLYPVYWCGVLFAALLFFWLGPAESRLFYNQMSVPTSFGSWMENLTFIYPRWSPVETPTLLSPPSWTLTVEWLLYALMAFGLSRGRRVTLIWFALALAYFATTHILGLGLEWRYSTLAAGALPFALGAGLFHLQPVLTRYKRLLQNHGLLLWLCGLILLNSGLCVLALVEDRAAILNVTFYGNLLLNAALIACLSLRPKPADRTVLERMDRVWGDLSYPTYILHLPVAFGLSSLILGRSERVYDETAMLLVILTALFCAAMGWALNYMIDRPIQRLRIRLRRP